MHHRKPSTKTGNFRKLAKRHFWYGKIHNKNTLFFAFSFLFTNSCPKGIPITRKPIPCYKNSRRFLVRLPLRHHTATISHLRNSPKHHINTYAPRLLLQNAQKSCFNIIFTVRFVSFLQSHQVICFRTKATLHHTNIPHIFSTYFSSYNIQLYVLTILADNQSLTHNAPTITALVYNHFITYNRTISNCLTHLGTLAPSRAPQSRTKYFSSLFPNTFSVLHLRTTNFIQTNIHLRCTQHFIHTRTVIVLLRPFPWGEFVAIAKCNYTNTNICDFADHKNKHTTDEYEIKGVLQ